MVVWNCLTDVISVETAVKVHSVFPPGICSLNLLALYSGLRILCYPLFFLSAHWMLISCYSHVIILLQTPFWMSFLSFREDFWKYKLSTLFLLTLPLTEVHVRVASNGRRKRERQREMHTLTNSFLLWTRKLAVFLLAYEEPKNVPCCQGNSCSLGSCNRKEARAIFIGSSLFYHQIIERNLESLPSLFSCL